MLLGAGSRRWTESWEICNKRLVFWVEFGCNPAYYFHFLFCVEFNLLRLFLERYIAHMRKGTPPQHSLKDQV